MSQASRSKVTATVRRREQLARELAEFISGPAPVADTATFSMVYTAVTGILDGAPFDVHRAREHALDLIRLDADNDHARQRRGLRLLDALVGHPSECQARYCENGLTDSGGFTPWDEPISIPCPACGGSGHNTRGYLPAIEWSPQLRRRQQDAEAHRTRRIGNDIATYGWCDWINESGIHGGVLWRGAGTRTCYGDPGWTRVVPRGEHRDLCMSAAGVRPSTLDERISDRGTLEWTAPERGDRGPLITPRWRRGELRHAEQRVIRELAKECRHPQIVDVDEDWARCTTCGDDSFPISDRAAGYADWDEP